MDTDRLLSEEELALRDTVRRFGRERLRPGLRAWVEEGRFPVDLVPELGKLGLLGMALDGYGCAGVPAVAYGLACAELEAVDSAFRSFVSVQGSLAMFAIHRYGSEEQRRAWLPRMASGEAIGCFGLTEPDHGSDPAGMRTRARRDGSDWVLDGTKAWITNGTLAEVAVVWARAADDAGGGVAAGGADGVAGKVTGFLVPRGTPGFEAHPVRGKLSLRASATAELVLDGVRVPESARLPDAVGLRAPLGCLDEARFGVLWGALGAARDSVAAATGFALQREQFGRPVAGFQLTQRKLAQAALDLVKGQLLALHLGRLKEAGALTPQQISAGKLNNVRAALDIARSCRTILGASGITLEYSPMRHADNLESVLTYEGTEEVHTLVLGQALTGLQAFR